MNAAAGPLADRLALSHRGARQNDADEVGFTDADTAAYTTEWAAVEPASSGWIERLTGVVVQGESALLARIYFRSDVTLTDTGVWTDRRGGTHQVSVRGFRPDPQGVWLFLALEERLPDE